MASANINTIPVAVSKRSKVDLSFNHHCTLDFGRLQVLGFHEVVPNDDFNISVDGFLRGAPMPLPTFGSIKADIRVFFVPNRILTSESSRTGFSWDDWISGTSAASHPYFNRGDLVAAAENFRDNRPYYHRDFLRHVCSFGIPYSSSVSNTKIVDFAPLNADLRFNPFPFMAFQRVWWDWYRDSTLIEENLLDSYVPRLPAGWIGSDSEFVSLMLEPRYACFKKDYFTTAKRQPQSGNASAAATAVASPGSDTLVGLDPNNVPGLGSGNIPHYGYTAIPVQWMRAANALQNYLERNNLSGSRLKERFLARFGVSPSEVMLGMSEYLGGNSSFIRIGDVTANNDGLPEDYAFRNAFTPDSGNIMGQTAGKSTADMSSGRISFHAKEYGTLLVVGSLVPNVAYTQGLPRSLTRGTDNDKFAYFTPEMQGLGYEPIRRNEILATRPQSEVFGYTQRYMSYKQHEDVVSGDLTLNGTSEGMDALYMSRAFDGTPLLSHEFVTISPEKRHLLDRIFSVPGNVGQFDHYQGVFHLESHVVRDLSNDALPSLEPDKNASKVNLANGGVRM